MAPPKAISHEATPADAPMRRILRKENTAENAGPPGSVSLSECEA